MLEIQDSYVSYDIMMIRDKTHALMLYMIRSHIVDTYKILSPHREAECRQREAGKRVEAERQRQQRQAVLSLRQRVALICRWHISLREGRKEVLLCTSVRG